MGLLNNLASTAAVFATLNGAADAFWRLQCHGVDGYARVDPLVNPNMAAAHNHAIHGAGNFGLNSTADDLLASDCTSCSVTQDKSAYWFPSLHFMYPNGTTVMVPQVGGLLAYYLLYSNPGEQIKAFDKGFSMVAGTSWRRNFTCEVPEPPKSSWSGYEVSQDALGQKALGFNCLNYSPGATTEPSLYRHNMPDKEFLDANCLDGIRLEIMFPSCWNGKDLTTKDHKSHVAYPSLVMNGACPAGYPVRVPSLFFESIWNTYAFKGVEGQFVFSNGDTTGYGNHADFIAAWEDGVLQDAVDQCTDPSGEQSACPVFNLQSDTDALQCKFPIPEELKDDNPEGPRNGLPGINPIVGKGLVKGADVPLPLNDAMAKVAPAGLDLPDVDVDVSDVSHSPDDEEAKPSPAATSSSAAATSTSASTSTTTSISSAPVSSAAAVTPAPSSSPSFITTIFSTSGSGVWKIFVEEAFKTVTADEAAETEAVKRHMHHHHYHPRHQ